MELNNNQNFTRNWSNCSLCSGMTYEENNAITSEHSIDCLKCGYHIQTIGDKVIDTGFQSPSVFQGDEK